MLLEQTKDSCGTDVGTRSLMGVSTLMRLAFRGGDLESPWNSLLARAASDATDMYALMDISTLLFATSQAPKALEIQSAAIGFQKVYRRIHGTGTGLHVAVFVAAGDLMVNTPVDFLMEGSNATIYYIYLSAETDRLPLLPQIDAAFLAIGESAATAAVLENCAGLFEEWNGPAILNGDPRAIATMTRDEVSRRLAKCPSVLAPRQTQVTLSDLTNVISLGDRSNEAISVPFPIIIRPVGTHGGEGLERITDEAGLAVYLAAATTDSFYLAPFVDNRGQDGLYRKMRIAFVNGKAFASHLAISSDWMVHYLSAEMTEWPERRAEEASWMIDFESDFAQRHAGALAEIADTFDLDYFAIDCAELRDGRLLVFEGDVIMIVHDMDPEDIFPYKKEAMQRIFDAFHSMLLASGGKDAPTRNQTQRGRTCHDAISTFGVA